MTKINSSSIVTLQQEGSGCDSQPGIFLHEVWVQSTHVWVFSGFRPLLTVQNMTAVLIGLSKLSLDMCVSCDALATRLGCILPSLTQNIHWGRYSIK